MEKDVYRRLQKHLDRHPIPFPETKSGVEIKLLKSLFTEDEAEITCELSTIPEHPAKIQTRLQNFNMTLDELNERLRSMVRKGLIMGVRDKKDKKQMLFSKMPLAIGIFEAQVDKITKETSELMYEYEKEGFGDALLGTKTKQMRTIPLNIKIDPEYQVSNYDDITRIIKDSPGPFGVMNCICRQAKDSLEEHCHKTDDRETCILLEGGLNFARNLDVGREITKEETLKLIKQAKKAGLVLQPENNQNPNFVCCCCGCCCGVLSAAKLYDKPAQYLHSNYYAEIKAEKCKLCETCLDRCPMDAILRTNNHMETDLDRCIGCGACIPTCSERAIKLIRKEQVHVPPKTSDDMYKKIMMERFGFLGTAKFVGKTVLGMKT